MKHQDRNWLKLWSKNSTEMRRKAILWRKQCSLIKIDKPSRIYRARSLGYKAKPGIITVRMRVGAGGMRKHRPKGGRRPKHLGVTRIKSKTNMKQVAENRVAKKYKNMTILGSYFVYGDSLHYWYEIVMIENNKTNKFLNVNHKTSTIA